MNVGNLQCVLSFLSRTLLYEEGLEQKDRNPPSLCFET